VQPIPVVEVIPAQRFTVIRQDRSRTHHLVIENRELTPIIPMARSNSQPDTSAISPRLEAPESLTRLRGGHYCAVDRAKMVCIETDGPQD
jgi:hypothetical protein